MNKPLNQNKESKWPDWHNKPIRLTVEEIENPNTVIEQFFQCYHLPDIRGCLQVWLQDALAKDTIESKQHFSTHIQVEKLVEAAWILNSSSEVTACDTKRSTERNQIYAAGYDEGSTSNKRYEKDEQFKERVLKNPVSAMHEAFSKLPMGDLLEFLLPNWLRTALLNDECQYSSAGIDRQRLSEFYDELVILIQALFILYKNSKQGKGGPMSRQEWLNKHFRCCVPSLSEDQIANPKMVITAFYEKFTIEYVRRELRDFLDAGVGYDGTYPKDFTPYLALETYEYSVCYTEAAFQLYRQLK